MCETAFVSVITCKCMSVRVRGCESMCAHACDCVSETVSMCVWVHVYVRACCVCECVLEHV